jgi:hypothetical protein
MLRHLVRSVLQATGQAQQPTVQADHDPSFEVARVPGYEETQAAGIRIEKVKFVFLDGVSPSVRCEGTEPIACDPSCVVWDVAPGTCEASAVLGGVRRSAAVTVQGRGGWACSGVAGRLACKEGR